MAHNVICAKNTWWLWSFQFCNNTKRMKTNQIIILQWHTTVDDEMFNVNIKNSSKNAKIIVKIFLLESQVYWRNGKLRRLLWSFLFSNLETWRYCPNLESPRLSRRVDSTAEGWLPKIVLGAWRLELVEGLIFKAFETGGTFLSFM